METPRPSTLAWLAVPAAIYLYDKHCPPNEMMSERFDEWMEHPVKRVVSAALVGSIALHLVNAVPENWDWVAHLLPPKESDNHET